MEAEKKDGGSADSKAAAKPAAAEPKGEEPERLTKKKKAGATDEDPIL